MNYYIVRAQWGDEDKSDEFIRNGEWLNGYGAEKYSLTVDMIEPGDIMILARQNQEIYNIGRCIENKRDFKNISVHWFDGFQPQNVGELINPYSRTINRLRSSDFFDTIKDTAYSNNTGLEDFLTNEIATSVPERIRINAIRIAWFKFFGKEIKFALDGKNMLLYGENGSGKTSFSDALRFLFQTGIVNRIDLIDYSNIFIEDNDVLIDLSLDNGESFTVSDSVDIGELNSNPILQSIALIDPFLTYKDVLLIYFKEIEQSGSKNLFTFFSSILDDYPIDTHRKLKDLEGEIYFRKLMELVNNLKDMANQFLEVFNENINIDRFHSDAYNRSITIDLKYRDQEVSAYQTFLNEAKLTALGLSVYFAAIIQKYSVLDVKCKILVLDDLLISLDMNHREAVLDILTQEHFEHYQKLILTHERGFFNMLKSRLKNNDWSFFEMYEKSSLDNSKSFPYLIPSLDFLEKAKDSFNRYDFESCANSLRKAAEEISIEFTGSSTNRSGQPMMLNDLLNRVKGQINQNPLLSQDIKEKIGNLMSRIQHFREAIFNPFSHADKDSPLYRKELEEAIDMILQFKEQVSEL